MCIFIDLILVAVIALCVYMSSRQGFVKVFVEVAGFVLAIIVTFTISTPLAELTYDKIIEPPMMATVGDALKNTNANVNDVAIAIRSTLPRETMTLSPIAMTFTSAAMTSTPGAMIHPFCHDD